MSCEIKGGSDEERAAYWAGRQSALVHDRPPLPLRDYFAASAVTWTEARNCWVVNHGREPTVEECAKLLADMRDQVADAMLEARER